MGFASNARGPIFPDLLEGLALNDSWGGMMFSATCVGTLLGSLLFQRILMYWTTLRALQLAIALAWIGLMGVSLSIGGPSLLGASFVFGIGSGAATLCQNLMIDQGSDPERRRRWYAGLHSSYGLASLLSPVAVVSLSRVGLDWPEVLHVVCAPLFVLVALFRWVRPLGRPPQPSNTATGIRVQRQGLMIALMAACAVSAELVISTRLVLHCERLGFTDVGAAGMLSLFFGSLLVSRLGLSVFRINISNRGLVKLSLALSLIASLCGLFIHPVGLALVALALGPLFPATMDLISEEFGGEASQTIAMLIVVVAIVLALVHALVGLISDLVSLEWALMVCPVLFVAAFGFLTMTEEPSRHDV
jgi:MFS family permease